MSEMMALQSMMGGGGPQAAPDGPPPQGQGGGDTLELIRQALELVRQAAVDLESEEDTLLAEKITTQLQQLLAQEEKEMNDAMTGKASPRMLRKAYGA